MMNNQNHQIKRVDLRVLIKFLPLYIHRKIHNQNFFPSKKAYAIKIIEQYLKKNTLKYQQIHIKNLRIFWRSYIKIIKIQMAEKQEQKLQTLDQLFNYNSKVQKACSLGLIIDATSVYHDQEREHYIKRLKIIDSSFNMTKPINGLKFGYCTVTIFAKRPDELPDVRALGDLIYLRRFAFEKYNDNFQSHSHKKQFCYWVLFDGNPDIESFSNYSSSRLNLNIQDEKFKVLLPAIQELRSFGKTFLQNNSISKVIPSGHIPKDEDWIVKLVLKGSHGRFRVQKGKQQYTLENCPSTMLVGDYGKLRSIVRVEDVDGQNKIVKSSFTSLIKIHDWTFDAQNAQRLVERGEQDDDSGVYTELSHLLNSPIGNVVGKTFWIKTQIFSISAASFGAAVKYYDSKKNILLDTPHKGTQPVYKLSFMAQDSSLKNKYAQIWIFSYDGKGANFVRGLNLNELNEYSSTVQEDKLYRQRYDELLEAEKVVMMVQCLSDGKNNRLLRVVEIK